MLKVVGGGETLETKLPIDVIVHQVTLTRCLILLGCFIHLNEFRRTSFLVVGLIIFIDVI